MRIRRDAFCVVTTMLTCPTENHHRGGSSRSCGVREQRLGPLGGGMEQLLPHDAEGRTTNVRTGRLAIIGVFRLPGLSPASMTIYPSFGTDLPPSPISQPPDDLSVGPDCDSKGSNHATGESPSHETSWCFLSGRKAPPNKANYIHRKERTRRK